MSDSELDWGDDDVGENEQGVEDDWGDMVEFDAVDAAEQEEKAEERRLAEIAEAVASIPPLPGQTPAQQQLGDIELATQLQQRRRPLVSSRRQSEPFPVRKVINDCCVRSKAAKSSKNASCGHKSWCLSCCKSKLHRLTD